MTGLDLVKWVNSPYEYYACQTLSWPFSGSPDPFGTMDIEARTLSLIHSRAILV